MSEPLDLEAIKARAEAATPGPWKLWGMSVQSDRHGTGEVDYSQTIAQTLDPDRGLRTFNAQFIAHAREDVPALVVEVERLRKELDEAQLRSIEARNPGIDMEAVKAQRAAGRMGLSGNLRVDNR
jgi:hypothetical protein